jgi:hypothetical protein
VDSGGRSAADSTGGWDGADREGEAWAEVDREGEAWAEEDWEGENQEEEWQPVRVPVGATHLSVAFPDGTSLQGALIDQAAINALGGPDSTGEALSEHTRMAPGLPVRFVGPIGELWLGGVAVIAEWDFTGAEIGLLDARGAHLPRARLAGARVGEVWVNEETSSDWGALLDTGARFHPDSVYPGRLVVRLAAQGLITGALAGGPASGLYVDGLPLSEYSAATPPAAARVMPYGHLRMSWDVGDSTVERTVCLRGGLPPIIDDEWPGAGPAGAGTSLGERGSAGWLARPVSRVEWFPADPAHAPGGDRMFLEESLDDEKGSLDLTGDGVLDRLDMAHLDVDAGDLLSRYPDLRVVLPPLTGTDPGRDDLVARLAVAFGEWVVREARDAVVVGDPNTVRDLSSEVLAALGSLSAAGVGRPVFVIGSIMSDDGSIGRLPEDRVEQRIAAVRRTVARVASTGPVLWLDTRNLIRGGRSNLEALLDAGVDLPRPKRVPLFGWAVRVPLLGWAIIDGEVVAGADAGGRQWWLGISDRGEVSVGDLDENGEPRKLASVARGGPSRARGWLIGEVANVLAGIDEVGATSLVGAGTGLLPAVDPGPVGGLDREPGVRQVSGLYAASVALLAGLPGYLGSLTQLALGGSASNLGFTVPLLNEGMGFYKPVAGEVLWQRERVGGGLLAYREVGAYVTSELLGFDLVSTTVLWQGPLLVFGPGSVQVWVDDARPGGGVSGYPLVDQDRMAVLDYVTGNTDRNLNNYLTRANGRPLAIDHGLTFPVGHQRGLRSSFIAERIGKPLHPKALAAVQALDADVYFGHLVEAGVLELAAREAAERLREVQRRGMITGESWPGTIRRSGGRTVNRPMLPPTPHPSGDLIGLAPSPAVASDDVGG